MAGGFFQGFRFDQCVSAPERTAIDLPAAGRRRLLSAASAPRERVKYAVNTESDLDQKRDDCIPWHLHV